MTTKMLKQSKAVASDLCVWRLSGELSGLVGLSQASTGLQMADDTAAWLSSPLMGIFNFCAL